MSSTSSTTPPTPPPVPPPAPVQAGNRHEFALLVRDKPGVLVRIALVFARRGFNIERLDVSPAGRTGFSEMSIVSRGAPQSVEQIGKQLGKLIDVVTVQVSARASNAPDSIKAG